MNLDYVIWSIEHQSWWGPNRSGYTDLLSLAGRYTAEDALAIQEGANWHQPWNEPNELAMPFEAAERHWAKAGPVPAYARRGR